MSFAGPHVVPQSLDVENGSRYMLALRVNGCSCMHADPAVQAFLGCDCGLPRAYYPRLKELLLDVSSLY